MLLYFNGSRRLLALGEIECLKLLWGREGVTSEYCQLFRNTVRVRKCSGMLQGRAFVYSIKGYRGCGCGLQPMSQCAQERAYILLVPSFFEVSLGS